KKLFVGKAGCERVMQLFAANGIDQIDFIDHDQIRFLQLLFVNVQNLFGKGCSVFEAENAQRTKRIDQHAEWCDGKALTINPAQRIADSGDEVGATADRFGNENIGTRFGRKLVCGFYEGIEPAAKATARNFFDAK